MFETVLVRRCVPVELPAHLRRMAAAAQSCDFPVPQPALWAESATAAAGGLSMAEEAMLRLVLARSLAGSGSAQAWVWAEDTGGRHARHNSSGCAQQALQPHGLSLP